ncbi:MAG: hypothetical protein GY719_10365 [bacterium]|nr:hypothetical protein [bacterium]
MSWKRLIIAWCALLATAAGASEVKIFRADSREGMIKGTLEGLRIDTLGRLELARRLDKVASLEEPFVFSAAGHARGWVVGTGNSGKVLRVAPGGEVMELHATPEPEVFAVHVDDDGTVLAGSSPDGKVYALGGGGAEVVFDPEDTYVWDLARDAEGRLLVATGLRGRLYRVAPGAEPEVLYESRDSHVRAVAVLPDGDVLVGTAGQGLIVRVGTDGEVATVHDAVHPEILDFAVTPSGTAYAAVLASEASFVDLSKSVAGAGAGDDEEAKEGAVTVTVDSQDTVGSRSSSFSGPRSLVLAISPEGKVEEVVSLQNETVHSLLWHDGELWIGSGQEGKLYRWTGERLIQETELEERQITGLVAGPAGVAAITANASALYRLEDGTEPEGIYVSSVLDSTQVARFGSFTWRGALPRGAGVEVAFRSGMSATPDATWTSWGDDARVACTGCENGAGNTQDVALEGLAHGRYVQWRATLRRGKTKGPRLESAELSYAQENLRPEIEKLEVLDPGQILVPSSFNPQNQTFEPWSPNREGIFTSLRLEAPKNGDGRLKNLWKKGYRTLRWSAEDPNQDEMAYVLDFRPEEIEDGWLRMVEDHHETHYSFDATVLPDGRYRFRLTASDGRARAGEEALEDEELSEPVVIDHTPPVLSRSARRGSTLEVELDDALSPMRDASVSFDAGEWRRARPVDGLLDGRREKLAIEVPEGTRLLLLRVTDAAHNVVTFDLLDE